MTDKILLNEEEYVLKESDLPCLITYAEKTGGSHYSVTMVAQMFLAGFKVLFLTAYPMAKENFLKQVGESNTNVAFVTNKEELENYKNAQCILIESGNEALFLEAVNALSNINERVVLLKNIEKFSNEVIEKALTLEKVILSGHLDECELRDKIVAKNYSSIVAFSKPEISLPINIPELEKYTGCLKSRDKEGVVRIKFS